MNLKQVRNKIKSVTNVRKITKAMQLVSAVKMKRAQQAAIEGRPYNETLQEIINRILPSVNTSISPLLEVDQEQKSKRDLVIVVSSSKGLAGAFNTNLFRLILNNPELKSADFITLGKKGAVFINLLKYPVIADYSSNQALNEVSAIFDMALEKFMQKQYKSVSIIYNRFISTLRSEPMLEKLLPITASSLDNEVKESDTEYMVEPTRNELLSYLLRSFVEQRIRNAVVNSEASEHSARMIAMKNATDNANDLIYDFTLVGNKLRQGKITSELLDMVTAKESIENLE